VTCVGGAGGCEEDGMQGGWAPGVRCDEAAVPGRVSCLAVLSLAVVLGRPGDDLLSQVLRHSTIGAEEFNGRVRDGIGFGLLARATRPAKDRFERQARLWSSVFEQSVFSGLVCDASHWVSGALSFEALGVLKLCCGHW
jgi:hypothetical protein